MVTPLGFVKDLVSTSQNSSVTMVNPNGELLNGLLTHSIIYLVTVLPLQMFIWLKIIIITLCCCFFRLLGEGSL